MNEHENEPIPGLPARLPEGETILWQGAPCWKSLARRAFHVGQIGVYFGVLLAWSISAAHADGTPIADAVMSALRVLPLAFLAVIILGVLAWLTSRTTLYTITNRRVVIRFGIALPMTWNVPFSMIDAAGLKAYSDRTGDLSVALKAGQRISYLVLWPHVRPWHLAHAEPTLRGIPDAASVAAILGRALSTAASQPVAVAAQIPVPAGATKAGAPHPAATAA